MNYIDKRLLTIALGSVVCSSLRGYWLGGYCERHGLSSGAGKLARLKPWPSLPPRASPPARKRTSVHCAVSAGFPRGCSSVTPTPHRHPKLRLTFPLEAGGVSHDQRSKKIRTSSTKVDRSRDCEHNCPKTWTYVFFCVQWNPVVVCYSRPLFPFRVGASVSVARPKP